MIIGRMHAIFSAAAVLLAVAAMAAQAQDRLPWEKPRYGMEPPPTSTTADPYRPGSTYRRTQEQPPEPPRRAAPYSRETAPRHAPPVYGRNDAYQPPQKPPRETHSYYRPDDRPRYQPDAYSRNRPPYGEDTRSPSKSYSENEIMDAGHRFFGSVSKGLAKAIARVFQQSGRPNGFILGEDAGGAFIAGLRYGEGILHTKHAGSRRVFWQGPTVGYDFGGEGSRTMVLVYNIERPSDIFRRFGGVQGSAYLVGGVGVQLLKSGDITLAPIRSGLGLRLGANIGYLKYTRRPTWNPF
ncbi:MAG TPA: DUF1134 domain-containing protein [Hyphomicrobiaceae bacterium]|nr:DUF1134 domain-containing protein [Hyphomicrobiaceae bacterium]